MNVEKKILRIDLSNRTYTEEWSGKYHKWGGHGLITKILCDDVDPKVDPLGEENKLVIAPGLLAGTGVPNCNRVSVGAKSPLTGGIKEANAGGTAGLVLARLGIAALVLEGRADEITLLKLGKDGVSFESAADLKGYGNNAVIARYQDDFAAIISIGQAGEMLARASGVSISTKEGFSRMAARGGLGAVMGSKNLKAIVIDDAGADKIELPDFVRDEFKATVKDFTKEILDHPLMGAMRALGTPVLVSMVNAMGAIPTKNYRYGTFDGHEKISGERMMEMSKERPNFKMEHRCCDGCVVSCSNVYTDEKGEVITAGLEYETLALIGSNCMIDDIDVIARINAVCNDVGVDTMDVGGALAIAMDAGVLPWGDGAKALELVSEIAKGTETGVMIANGGQYTGEKLGIKRIPAVKRQILAGYDPRFLKGTGVTYATSPQGADHTAGNALPMPGNPYDPTSPEGQGAMSQFLQRHHATVDSLGICIFPMLTILGNPGQVARLTKCVSLLLGEPLPESYIDDLGKEILAMQKTFNRKAGLTSRHDRLPEFFTTEKLETHSTVFDVPESDLDSVI